jgi:hypothetical protein
LERLRVRLTDELKVDDNPIPAGRNFPGDSRCRVDRPVVRTATGAR